MSADRNHYESALREDLIRLGVTAAIVIGLLALVTMLQQRTGFMNAVVVLPQESLEEGAAPTSLPTSPIPAPE